MLKAFWFKGLRLPICRSAEEFNFFSNSTDYAWLHCRLWNEFLWITPDESMCVIRRDGQKEFEVFAIL
jgi:hypothetical protein